MKNTFVFIFLEIILTWQLKAQNLDRTITKDQHVEFISKSKGITNVPYYVWSKYSNVWIKKENGGIHDNTNFDTLSISKYKTGNKIYYAFFYNSHDPYTLDIDTQILQIKNGTYRGEGAIGNILHSFYITQHQYDKFVNFLKNGKNGDSFTLKSRLTEAWLENLLYKGAVKYPKKMKFLRYQNKIRFRLPLGKDETLFGKVSLKKEYFEVDVDYIINQLLVN